jgi:hypothetical protein
MSINTLQKGDDDDNDNNKFKFCKQFDEIWNTSYQHAQYRKKNKTSRNMIECVFSYTVTYARKLG